MDDASIITLYKIYQEQREQSDCKNGPVLSLLTIVKKTIDGIL